ncbi:hypothetical protein C6A87_002890 [Mycobacterium sp. ITM-2016-00317]|uniref:hypothetical protein n=1 Tax=Mycobacterium sp. ITM-2016-00317 TaxID=2099694 RepID=UPI00287F6026|nr:hypothetical protein [Mycobacterium sp. ITM-2016-00317]WNG88220.1 hypothetical protein C6A87_002890 [Mycobacterium sp. ITM-2016-00317]
MTHPVDRHVRRLTTPRAAAFAGVLFALLFGAVLVLIRTAHPDTEHRLRIAVVLMPFAGIAFLWFLGVVRDGLGVLEDRFFATVFLGSGLMFLAMIFASTAVGAGVIAVRASAGLHSEVVTFGQALLVSLSNTYALRMAAVFMISLATIWLRTRLMPGWLVAVTYVVALCVLVGSDLSPWTTVSFPIWVLVVSVLLLMRAGVIDLPEPEHSPGTA